MTKADTLIAAASRGQTIPDPPRAAIAELEKILAHNDAAPHGSRVSATATIEMLRGFGWIGTARGALDSLCARRYSRRSFARGG